MKKWVGSGIGSGSISHRYGSGDLDPHQNVTDTQHCFRRDWRYHGIKGFLSCNVRNWIHTGFMRVRIRPWILTFLPLRKKYSSKIKIMEVPVVLLVYVCLGAACTQLIPFVNSVGSTYFCHCAGWSTTLAVALPSTAPTEPSSPPPTGSPAILPIRWLSMRG
jgi:hypothetical protein